MFGGFIGIEGIPALVEKPTGKTFPPFSGKHFFWAPNFHKQAMFGRLKETTGKPIFSGVQIPAKNGHPSCVPWAPSPTSQEGLLQLVRPLGRRQGGEFLFCFFQGPLRSRGSHGLNHRLPLAYSLPVLEGQSVLLFFWFFGHS